jgi:hypothetical protein
MNWICILSFIALASLPRPTLTVGAEVQPPCKLNASKNREIGILRVYPELGGVFLIIPQGSGGTMPITAGHLLLYGISKVEDGRRVSYRFGFDASCTKYVRDLRLE